MYTKISGLLSVIMCFILVGSSYPVAKEAMDSIPTWTFTCISFAIGFIFLLPFTLFREKTNWFNISLKDSLMISVLALLGAVLYTVFLLYGLPTTTAISASVITSATPAVVLVISVLCFKEKLKLNTSISVILAIISVVVMTLPGSQGSSNNTLTGLVFLSLSTLSNAVNIIVANKVSTSLKPLTMAAGVCLAGAVFSLPMAVHESQSFSLLSITRGQAGVLVYYGVFVWALAYMFFFKGIGHISAASAGMCVALTPVASMACSALFFGDAVKHTDLIATVIIIFSVIFSEVDLFKLFKKKTVTRLPREI